MKPQHNNKLSINQIEFLAKYLLLYKKSFYHITGKRLQTVEEIIKVIEDDEITWEDIYLVYLEDKIGFDYELNCFIDDNSGLFSFENYFPSNTGKCVEDGSWIKIRTETGYEIHWAVKSRRKHRFREEAHSLMLKLNSVYNGSIKELLTTGLPPKQISESTEKRIKKIKDRQKEVSIRIMLDIPVYEVSIRRTKTKTEYLLPYQYEPVEDVTEITEYYLQKVTGVEIKPIFTSENKDKIHYLMSRGIPRRLAEIMASLNQSYFKVDIVLAMEEYNKQWNEGLKLLKTA